MGSKAQSLLGVGIYESDAFYGFSVSYAGGAPLWIKSYSGAFDEDPAKNQVSFTLGADTRTPVVYPLRPLSGK